MTQTTLNKHIGYIQYLQAQLAQEYAKAVLYGSRGRDYYRNNNNLISTYLDILYRQDMTSDYNSLTEREINNIIEDSYRRLYVYN